MPELPDGCGLNRCALHGTMVYVADGINRYFSCADWSLADDVPMPVAHDVIVLDGPMIPRRHYIPPNDLDLPRSPWYHEGETLYIDPGDIEPAYAEQENDPEEADEPMHDEMAPAEGDINPVALMFEEIAPAEVDIDAVAMMQRLVDSYDTAEEQIAMEAMLSQYET